MSATNIDRFLALLLLSGTLFGFQVEFTSDALLANGVADFVIERGNKKVIVVVAKKKDYIQDMIELLVLMDIAVSNSIKDGIPSDRVYGIVTENVQWEFFQRSASAIPLCTHHISPPPNRDRIEAVASRLYGILHN
ncbi:hypothetical protein PHYPSEUDO_000008 [Phytophthora pseudosyringae]|uniref:Uncharacterized protein n=1 Tax=Phytophthora pseudosyringae TaxID=221518 RepID=A0A8T1WKX1_9STRA|nr:hypothetical protein PHYPSEUDO_000008 [Phytophthora pseudosyringae]